MYCYWLQSVNYCQYENNINWLKLENVWLRRPTRYLAFLATLTIAWLEHARRRNVDSHLQWLSWRCGGHAHHQVTLQAPRSAQDHSAYSNHIILLLQLTIARKLSYLITWQMKKTWTASSYIVMFASIKCAHATSFKPVTKAKYLLNVTLCGRIAV